MTQKNTLLTGGATGIATAQLHPADGTPVVGTGRNPETLAPARAKPGLTAVILASVADVRRSETRVHPDCTTTIMQSQQVPLTSWDAASRLCVSLLLALTLCAGTAAASENANNVSTMQTKDQYTTSFTVEQTPEEAFAAITHVRGWWSGEFVGNADKLGAEFTYRVPNMHYSKQKVVEWVPGARIVWHVLEADLTFVNDKREWEGTDIVFEIARKDGKTEVRFTHRGLVPSYECYDKCSNAWGALVTGNLRKLIVTGEVQPSPWGPHPERAPASGAKRALRAE